MNQMKIGKFIKELRIEKKMTQADLAEKLGVSNRAVSKWENGINMPDVSLLRPICEIFDITINELLSAEKIEDENKAKKLEENYICAVDSKIKLQNDVAGHIILKFFGYVLLLIAYGYFDTEPFTWVNIFIIVGVLLIVFSSYKLVKSWNLIPKIIYVLVIFLMLCAVILFLDFKHVEDREISHPHFYIRKAERGKCVAYKALTWNCISYKDDEYKNLNGGPVCYTNLVNDVIDYTKEKYCDENYDYRYDCDVVRCDENGTPLHLKDNEESN